MDDFYDRRADAFVRVMLRLWGGAFCAGLLLGAGCAMAQPICLPRADMIAALADQWGEQRRATATVDGSQIVEVWVSHRTLSWTLLVTRPDGTSCALLAGSDWHEQAIGERS